MMVKPDFDEYSPLEVVALKKAGINPDFCRGKIRTARRRQLPGSDEANRYYHLLMAHIEAGMVPYKVASPPKGVMGSDDILISKKDADDWEPDKLTNKDSSFKKAKMPVDTPGALLIVALLTKEFADEKKLYSKYPGKGVQAAITNHILDLVIKYNLVDKNLSVSTIERTLKNARELFDRQKLNDDVI